MASVAIRKVEKSFGPTRIIRGVDVEVADGEFVVLVGPSGCGKSTLLRMIAGLESVSGGEIAIGSRVVNDTPPKDRDVAMVFQNYALYPHMSVKRNMGFALQLRKMAGDEIETRIEKAARILGLDQLLDRLPRQLSGGQRQRVAMGRAIVRDPSVFLFDEPLSNLDAKLRVSMRAEIKALHQRLGTTTIYVTHDQIEAMTMADRIVVMHDGIVEQIGAPLELYDHPANQFVAGFIGSPAMNFVSGTITGGAMVDKSGMSWAIPPVAVAEGAKVTLGVRPEHLHITSDGVAAEIVVVEPTGSETMVILDSGGNRLSAVLRERIAIKHGERVALSYNPALAHLFDAQSGVRLG